METISIYEAKTQLCKYINSIEKKEVDSFVITKNGRPIAQIIPFVERKKRRLGIAKGLWKDISENEFDDFDALSIMMDDK